MDSTLRKVPIKNVLYMFSYIRDKAEFFDYKKLSNEDDFDSVNILTELFLLNVDSYFKRWIYREYSEINEELKGIKWKIDFKESINKLSFQNAKAVCSYDEFEANNTINKIIKSTAYRLYKSSWIKDEYKKKLNNTLLYLNQVDLIDANISLFNTIRFNKNNMYCFYFIMICKLILESTMLSENVWEYKFINILDDDDRMANIFELFVYKFYQKKLNAKVFYQKQLQWNLEWENRNYLPTMNLDIYIETENEAIVIDTKYYKDILSENMWSKSFKSNNMYQVYTYMNHLETDKNVRGILLYPYNWEIFNEQYDTKLVSWKAAKFEFRTIDLSKDWREIESDLLEIVRK
mgnify:CR=1 FL=1